MALLLALIVWLLTAVSVWLLIVAQGAKPLAISAMARDIDAQFLLTMVITGVVFVLAQGLLGLFILKYRDRPGGKARFIHGNNLVEAGGGAIIGVVFVGLAVMAQNVWARLHLNEAPPNQTVIEVTGEQFAWNVRYPGPDGRFGRTSPTLYDATKNPVGIDPADPAGGDDVVVLNNLAVPVGQAVELQLKAKDVIHSFFMPALRLKQDSVPGLRIPLRFTAEQTGEYEVACAELCGLGHYRMRGTLLVLEPAAYQAWLAERAPQ